MHFVPRFYLKRFLNHDMQVEVLDFKNERIATPKGVGGICYGDFFYSQQTGEVDELGQIIEEWFKKMEDQIAPSLDPIISKLLNNEQILPHEKWMLSLLMSMIWIRGPVMRERINRMSDQIVKQINTVQFGSQFANSILDKIDIEVGGVTSAEIRKAVKEMLVKQDYTLEFDNTQHMLMFEEASNYANLFNAQHWLVYISRLPEKFITTDNPVVVTVPKTDTAYDPTFLDRKHYFPLTPDICIEATYPHKSSKKTVQRKTLFPGNEREVLSLNLLLAGHSHQYA